jgi:Fur family ferric uptake transcriptional regulator
MTAPEDHREEQDLTRARERLSEYLALHGLKQTRQREAILEAFLDAGGHITSEELYERVRGPHPEIGAATVYRSLKLFCDAGIAHPSHFRSGVTVYEHRAGHHDHLICVGCGEIVEFECSLIEGTQLEIADRYGYRLVNHRHDLYGYCRRCQTSGQKDA